MEPGASGSDSVISVSQLTLTIDDDAHEHPSPLVAGPPIRYPYPLPLFAAEPACGRWLPLIERLVACNEPVNSQFISLQELKQLVAAAVERLSAEPNYLTLMVDVEGPEQNVSRSSSTHSSVFLPAAASPTRRSAERLDANDEPLSSSAVSKAVNCSPPIHVGEDLVLVGDIHGQYIDLLTSVLSVQGRARAAGQPDKTFLFLGDYVDRGPQSVETLLLLLAMKVEYPGNVYLLRGNHEETETCKNYGFMAECRHKLLLQAWYQFTSVFGELPIAAIIRTQRGSIFACHGGLSPGIMSAPEEVLTFTIRQSYGQGLSGSDDVIDGLLWSDPGNKPGFESNPRGCGFKFGEDAAESFCSTNGFDFVIRAHQMVQQGYHWDHHHRVLTIFSAPNYCGISDNLGSICIIHKYSDWIERGMNQPLALDVMTKMPIRNSPLAPEVGRRARLVEQLIEHFGFGCAEHDIAVDPGDRSPTTVAIAPPGSAPKPLFEAASPNAPPTAPAPPAADLQGAMMDYFETSVDAMTDAF